MTTEQETVKTQIGANGVSAPSLLVPKRHQKRGRIPKWGIAAMVAVAFGLSWFVWAKTHPPQDVTSNMILGQVTTGSLIESVSATGSVTPQTGAEVNIGSQITGIIKRLYADVGGHVKAGQLIAVLDLPTLTDQYAESSAALGVAQTKLQQAVSGVNMTDTQIRTALGTATEAAQGAKDQLATARATASQQIAQTPADIQRAETSLSASLAALVTAQAVEVQSKAGATEQIATAKEQQVQTTATAANASAELKRQQSLLSQGFVAQSVVDQNQATATVDQSLVVAAQQNVALTEQSVTANLQTQKDAVAQAGENVKAARASLAAARSETFTTQAKLDAVAGAQSAVVQSQEAVQVANANLAQIQQEQESVQEARDTAAQAQAASAFSQAQLNESYIRTPISGTVISLAEQQGDTVAGGLSAPTLVIVADLTRLEVDTYVDESDVSSVKLGQDADVVLDAFPKHTFHGKVTKIASGSTVQNGIVTYDVVISLNQEKNKTYQILPDMTANVTIETGNLTNVLLVPAVAVQVGVNKSTVSVVENKNGQTKISPVTVTTGGSDGTNIQILSGLTVGQTVVVAGAPVVAATAGASPFSQHGGGGGSGRGGGGH